MPRWASKIRVNSRDGEEMTVTQEQFPEFIKEYADIEYEVTPSAEVGTLIIRILNSSFEEFVKIKMKNIKTLGDLLDKYQDELQPEMTVSLVSGMWVADTLSIQEAYQHRDLKIRNYTTFFEKEERLLFDEDWGLCVEV